MVRLPDLPPDAMTPEQRRVHDDIIAGPRGRIAALHKVWLQSPEFADHSQKLGAFLRFEGSLPPHLSEMAILITSRFWEAGNEWHAHVPMARTAGLDEAVITAIAGQQRPEGMQNDGMVVYDVSTQLLQTHRLDDATYDRAIAQFGERGVVELVGVVGYYCMVCMTLNTFQIRPPADVVLPFPR